MDVVRNIPGHDDGQARVITGTVDGVRVIGAYVVVDKPTRKNERPSDHAPVIAELMAQGCFEGLPPHLELGLEPIAVWAIECRDKSTWACTVFHC